MSKPSTTRVNALLKKAGYRFRLVRGQGYYYLYGDGLPNCSTGLYVYRLDPTEYDFQLALSHVNTCLLYCEMKTI